MVCGAPSSREAGVPDLQETGDTMLTEFLPDVLPVPKGKSRPFYSLSTSPETEAQRGWVTCPRPHSSQQILELRTPGVN